MRSVISSGVLERALSTTARPLPGHLFIHRGLCSPVATLQNATPVPKKKASAKAYASYPGSNVHVMPKSMPMTSSGGRTLSDIADIESNPPDSSRSVFKQNLACTALNSETKRCHSNDAWVKVFMNLSFSSIAELAAN
jgi:hypothetical protein